MSDVTLFIPFARDVKLLKHNLEYYTAIGINRILLSIHIRQEWEKGFLDTVNEIIANYPATIADIHCKPGNASKERYERVISKHCRNNDWVIVADLDEFYEYSMPLADVVNYCEEKSYDYVTGEFLDRVGPMGERATIQGNIWDSFPVGLRLTKNIGKGCVNKVVLARAGIKLTGGHHRALSGNGCPISKCSAIVHHFKWDSSCIERIQYMKNMYTEENLPWVDETIRMEEFIKINGDLFPIDNPALEAYWPMYKRSISKTTGGLQSVWEDPTRVIPEKVNTLEIKRNSDSNFDININASKTLEVNQSYINILSLCDGYNTVSDIASIIRDAYPSDWPTIEYDIQWSLRELYAQGLISSCRLRDYP